ncbi:MAG: hypothetical protein JWM77_1503 [Rhodospirillales bacterium]|nr:hypothetical protein [Rhodospirillales bacterium]
MIRTCCAVALVLAVSAPAAAGPPFFTDDPQPPELGHFEINIAAQGVRHSGGREGFVPGVDANYGATPDLQLHLAAGLATQKSNGQAAVYGYGDTELGAKFRFLHQEEIGWDVAAYPIVVLPSGDARRGLGAGHTRTLLPLWVQKDFGDWSTFGGGGYWINPGAGNKNYWVAAWALLRRIDDRLSLGGELFHQTSGGADNPARSGFNVGGLLQVTDNGHLLFSAGRGLTQATATNQFSYYLGYRIEF